MTWQTAVFIDCNIFCEGGALVLMDVSFIHYTSRTRRSDYTEKLLRYVSVEDSSLAVYPEFFRKFAKPS